MYEVDNLFAWIMQHSTQEVIGILVGAIAVAIPLTCIVLAFIDTVIDYALRYVNEDKEQRRVIKAALSYEKQVDIGAELKKVVKGKVGWIFKFSFIDYARVKNLIGRSYADDEGDYSVRKLSRVAEDKEGVVRTIKLSILGLENCLYSTAILAMIGVVLFFLPLWLVLSVGICYAVLRTARFITRYSKKFNTHIKKEH